MATWTLDSDPHSPALLDIFPYSDTYFIILTFPPLRNSDHVVVSVSIDFQSNSQQDALFHCITYDYSRADWDGLYYHLRDLSLEDIFKLSASAAVSEFCEWVLDGHSGIDDWDFVIFEQCQTHEQLKERETFWQRRLKLFIQ